MEVPLPSPQETDPDDNFEDLINDMNLIGEITINEEDGLLSFPDFCRLFQLIKKHVEPRLVNQLAILKANRRRELDNHELHEYRFTVLQMNEIEGEICN